MGEGVALTFVIMRVAFIGDPVEVAGLGRDDGCLDKLGKLWPWPLRLEVDGDRWDMSGGAPVIFCDFVGWGFLRESIRGK